MQIPWNHKPSKVVEFYVRKPQITPRRPPFEESRPQIISVEEDKAAICEGCFGDSKILEDRESTELYDNPKPSTSYQNPITNLLKSHLNPIKIEVENQNKISPEAD